MSVLEPSSNPSLLSSSFETVTVFLLAINHVSNVDEELTVPSETLSLAFKNPDLLIDDRSYSILPYPSDIEVNTEGIVSSFRDALKVKSAKSLSISV